ncbi:MAG: phosphatase PAP2/dual specificity phosphatase family protein [Gemmataceae bacterium]
MTLLMRRALMTSISLSALFLLLYGGTNWFTAQRSNVGTWYFDWELGLPYVPLLIVPYMSIDLFFFAAPFLCRSEREMTTFARRVTFSILVASTLFLLLPLTLVWRRPHIDGGFGDFVEASCTVPYLMAYPHNLFPSLHITLRTILAIHYARLTTGFVRVLSDVWFSLIGFSTVLTYQHHLIDIAGGFVLAAVAFYLFRESPPNREIVPNPTLGRRYAVLAGFVVTLAVLTWRWGVFLLPWGVGLGTIAAGYFGLGPGAYRKEDGKLPWSARFVLAPVLLGQWLSLRYYARQCRHWDEVVPGVWIGRVLSSDEAAIAIQGGVTAVLDLTAEFSETQAFRRGRYCNIQILDLTAPTAAQIADAVAFITKEASRGTVYVHCKIGYSRSAAVVGAYLLTSGHARSAEEAIAHLRAVRPTIVVRPESRRAIEDFSATVGNFACDSTHSKGG